MLIYGACFVVQLCSIEENAGMGVAILTSAVYLARLFKERQSLENR